MAKKESTAAGDKKAKGRAPRSPQAAPPKRSASHRGEGIPAGAMPPTTRTVDDVELEVVPGGIIERIEGLERRIQALESERQTAAAESPQQTNWDPYEEGRRILEELKAAGGGALDRNEAARRLELTTAALHQRKDRGEIVAWPDPVGRFKFPKWQFSDRGILPGIAECLHEMRRVDRWAVMAFFLSPSEALGGKRPLDLLREGKIAAAVEVARARSSNC